VVKLMTKSNLVDCMTAEDFDSDHYRKLLDS
jgi:hypothetical protein